MTDKSAQDVTIFHNPRCSKSRQALTLLEQAGITPHIRLYLDETPTQEELHDLLAKLGCDVTAILRRSEEAFKAHFTMSDDHDTLISLLTQHPKVLERPIIIKGDKAVIGRPPEAVHDLI